VARYTESYPVLQEMGAVSGTQSVKQGAAEITPTIQRGITNKWYEISSKTFYFPNVDIKKFFTLCFQNYIVQMVAVTADKHLEPFFLNGLL
jgi:hypothetical protein